MIANTDQKEYDWPRWRGPNGDGISPETDWNPKALENGPKIVWKKNVGMGYIKGKDVVSCLEAETGKEKWQFSYPCELGQYSGPRATPCVDGDAVYTMSQEGDLHRFRAADGKVQWHINIVEAFKVYAPSWGFAGSPVVEGDLVILNAGVNGIAVDKKTGKKIWVSGSGAGGYATPVMYDYEGKRHAAIFGQKALYAVFGMTQVVEKRGEKELPLIAVTTIGITTPGAMKAKEVLNEAGFDTIVFHAVGTGGWIMESLMKD